MPAELKELAQWLATALLIAAATGAGIWGWMASTVAHPARSTRTSQDSYSVLAHSRHVNPKALSGGELTVFQSGVHAFGHSAPTLPIKKLPIFAFGNRLFQTNWVIAPASVQGLDGLGPVFNRVSCAGCHTRDGRGRPPELGESLSSMVMRLSVPGEGPHGGPKPHPRYGLQLNDSSIPGVPAEGQVVISSYRVIKGEFPDGTPYTLRKPVYEFKHLAFGPLGEKTMTSPRVAPATYGVGLLEAVPKETILSFADPSDANGDGISGRPNWVWDAVHNKMALGRFGWKANVPNVRQQAASAMHHDIGITTSIFPNENVTPIQDKAAKAISGGEPELSDKNLDRLVFYLKTLAVPARRNLDDPQVILGEKLFNQIGCAKCHIPTMRTKEHTEIPILADQVIHPYTDLLLHDMGPGLADGRPHYRATGREWRTPPLWGIGLVDTVNGHTRYLHDGRARNLTEAILWHGGEAEASKQAFMHLPKEDRKAIIAFLRSL